ncbi:Mariner Mos1 transposase [Acromyrmex echinatior]|uniref:Mariner Mos1 transposase n=1 Tax=Acromyrmex echinatior TaxID=103372 RepID=F4X2Y5_ACREC|nr:Mariner Mos1 transposase [Acromyrmex echinatior]
MAKKKVLYHHDNAPSHTFLKAMVKLDQLRFKLVAHPPYSPDLAPSDYYLFSNLKRWLQGRRFTSNEEVIAETEAYFEGLDVPYYRKGIEMLENRYTKCIALEGQLC